MIKGSHQITMDEIQGRGGALSLPFFKILLRMFAKNTSLTNSFGKMNVGKVNDHSLLVELLHLYEIKMTKYFVP